MSRVASLGLLIGALSSCMAFDTVDPGDDPPIRTAALDRDFFICRIQPEVLSASGCATGEAGESCHANESSYRLTAVDASYASGCVDGAHSAPPPDVDENFVATAPWVFENVENSPLLTRPTGAGSHPRVVFGIDSAEANLIREWVSVRR